MADVERFELSYLYLYLYLYLVPDIDINRCRGYCTDHGGDDQPMVGWQIFEGLLGSARHTRWGIGVIRMNPRYRWKRSSIHNRPYVWRKYP
jgi:hypothetical protein